MPDNGNGNGSDGEPATITYEEARQAVGPPRDRLDQVALFAGDQCDALRRAIVAQAEAMQGIFDLVQQRHGRRRAAAMTGRVTVLGTVTIEPGETVAFDIPLDASPAEIAAALVAAEEERIAAQARESRRLRKLFLGEGPTDE
jgi:hypothetical protein